MKRWAELVLIAGIFVTSITACSKGGYSGNGTSDRLRVAININPTQLNPILAQNTIETFADSLFFNLLVTHDQHHHQLPELAQTVPSLQNGGISKDGLTLIYHLRRGIKWQDGVPFTSRDVKFTWQAVMNPRNNVVSRRGYDLVASMDTPDDATVVMHMKQLFPPAVDTIFAESDTPTRILPAHLLAKYPNLNQIPFNSAPVGTGPYRFVRWQRGDRIVVQANPDYFGGAPAIKEMTLAIIPDDNTTQAQLQSGEANLALEIPSAVYRGVAATPGIRRQLAQAPAYTAVIFNTRHTPLDDVRVRRALVLGMDRDAITRDNTSGTGTLAVGDLGPYYWTFDPTLRPTPYDPALAKQLLDAAGWRAGPDGVRVRNGNASVAAARLRDAESDRAHHHGPNPANVSRAGHRSRAQGFRLRDALRRGAERRNSQRGEVRPGDVRLGLRLGSRRLVTVVLRDDTAGGQQHRSLLFAGDGSRATPCPFDF